MDRLRRIEMMVRAADAGSFAKAAISFDVAPSAISRSIAQLEKELKLTLFYRTTRQLRLTQEGQEFYRKGRELLDKLVELESNASTSPARLIGTLRVGISVPVSRLVIMPLLPQFGAKHPDLRIEFVVLFHPKDLHAEGVDLLLRVSEPPDSGLIARELVRIKHAVFASPKYLEQAGTPSDPDELPRHRCLVLKPAFLGRLDDEWKFERDGVRKTINITEPAVVTADREGLIDAAVAGAGLMRLGFFDPALLTTGRLRRVLVDWNCPLSYSIYAMYRKSPRLAPKIAAFLEFAAGAFAAFDPEELTLVHSPALQQLHSGGTRSAGRPSKTAAR